MYDLDIIKQIPIEKFVGSLQLGQKKKVTNGWIYEKCPFCSHKWHFVVYTNNNIYKSFNSCCSGNNVIDFIIRTQNIDFKQAVELLASEINVKEIRNKLSKNEILDNKIYECMEATRLQNMFNKFFKYLKEKKLDQVFEIAYRLDQEKLIHFIYNFKAKYSK